MKLEEFSEEKIVYIALKVMMILDYLHEKNIYYGDLKPDNILIFQNYEVKLGDFGISIIFNSD